MFTQNYLSLRLVRVRPADGPWAELSPELNFVFSRGGSGKCISGSMTQRIAPGDVLVLNSGTGARLCAADRSELVFWTFSASVEHLFPLFASLEMSNLQNVLDGLKPLKVFPANDPLAPECHRLLQDLPPQFNLQHRSQLLRVVAAILAPQFNNAQAQRVGFVRVEEHMVQVFENLSSNELLQLSVGDLAKKFGCSRRHLNRLFHQYFGLSVATLRMEMRMSKAVSLLKDPDAKVIRVAEDCGFNHLGLFNTCFKRRFGVSPGQWRKRIQPEKTNGRETVGGEVVCPMRINGLCPWDGRSESTAEPGHSTGTAKGMVNVKKNQAARVGLDPRVIRQSAYGSASLQVAS